MGDPTDTPTIRLRVVEDDEGWTEFSEDTDFEDELIVDVPRASWVAYRDAQEAMMAAHAALCASIGFSTHGGTALEPCAAYNGESWPRQRGAGVIHSSCRTCGRSYGEHQHEETS